MYVIRYLEAGEMCGWYVRHTVCHDIEETIEAKRISKSNPDRFKDVTIFKCVETEGEQHEV